MYFAIQSNRTKNFRPRRLAPAHGMNQRFHLIQVTLQRVPPRGAKAVHRLGQAAFKVLLALDVLRFFEFARVDAQVAVRGGSNFFRSLKLRDSFAARALTMPSRMRSWIRRSSSAAAGPAPARAPFGQRGRFFVRPAGHAR